VNKEVDLPVENMGRVNWGWGREKKYRDEEGKNGQRLERGEGVWNKESRQSPLYSHQFWAKFI
jgi:hypothetical protein